MKKTQPAILRVLIVEDTAERQEWLTSLFREHAWVLVHTAARAVCLINAYKFDLVSLDYNLAGPDDGDSVAEVIAQSANATTSVLIHSMNPRGATRLAELLPHAESVPVASLMRSNRRVKKIREALRHGVPENWQELVHVRRE